MGIRKMAECRHCKFCGEELNKGRYTCKVCHRYQRWPAFLAFMSPVTVIEMLLAVSAITLSWLGYWGAQTEVTKAEDAIKSQVDIAKNMLTLSDQMRAFTVALAEDQKNSAKRLDHLAQHVSQNAGELPKRAGDRITIERIAEDFSNAAHDTTALLVENDIELKRAAQALRETLNELESKAD